MTLGISILYRVQLVRVLNGVVGCPLGNTDDRDCDRFQVCVFALLLMLADCTCYLNLEESYVITHNILGAVFV